MSSILAKALLTRQFFDPKNAAHLESLKSFISTGNWGKTQFHAELPFVEVPACVLHKYAQHMLKVKPESSLDRATRCVELKIIKAPMPARAAVPVFVESR